MEDPKDVRIRELETEVRKLKEFVVELLGRLSKNSLNSLKTPICDIVSPPKNSNKNGKKTSEEAARALTGTFLYVETTCEQRERNLLDFITQTFVNYLQGVLTSRSFIS